MASAPSATLKWPDIDRLKIAVQVLATILSFGIIAAIVLGMI